MSEIKDKIREMLDKNETIKAALLIVFKEDGNVERYFSGGLSEISVASVLTTQHAMAMSINNTKHEESCPYAGNTNKGETTP